MAYGDKMDFGKIKSSRLFYQKPSEKDFDQNWITVNIINTNNWCYTLEFENRKEWFKFVRKINHINKIIKKKNIEGDK